MTIIKILIYIFALIGFIETIPKVIAWIVNEFDK